MAYRFPDRRRLPFPCADRECERRGTGGTVGAGGGDCGDSGDAVSGAKFSGAAWLPAASVGSTTASFCSASAGLRSASADLCSVSPELWLNPGKNSLCLPLTVTDLRVVVTPPHGG
jgi:hypothetical protein